MSYTNPQKHNSKRTHNTALNATTDDLEPKTNPANMMASAASPLPARPINIQSASAYSSSLFDLPSANGTSHSNSAASRRLKQQQAAQREEQHRRQQQAAAASERKAKAKESAANRAEASRGRAQAYVQDFLERSETWRDMLESDTISVVWDAVPTMEELEGFGEMDEAEGTMACRRLFKAVVIWDELGHSLWEKLRVTARQKKDALKGLGPMLRMGTVGDDKDKEREREIIRDHKSRGDSPGSGQLYHKTPQVLSVLPEDPPAPPSSSWSTRRTRSDSGDSGIGGDEMRRGSGSDASSGAGSQASSSFMFSNYERKLRSKRSRTLAPLTWKDSFSTPPAGSSSEPRYLATAGSDASRDSSGCESLGASTPPARRSTDPSTLSSVQSAPDAASSSSSSISSSSVDRRKSDEPRPALSKKISSNCVSAVRKVFGGAESRSSTPGSKKR